MSALGSAEDFSIFVISGTSNVPIVIHSRRSDSGGMTTYTVRTYLSGTLAEELSYAYSLATSVANDVGVLPGAVHYWLRSDTDWAISDDLGAQVVFPDPTAYPYEVSSADSAKTFSRFVLFLPTRP
jgi:hypothetical protein